MQTGNILNILLTSNTLNFCVVAGIVIFICYKLDIKKKTDNARAEIENYVKNAENEKNTALEKLEDARNAVQNLPVELETLKSDTELNIKNLKERSAIDTRTKKKELSDTTQRLLKLEIKDFNQKLSDLLSEKSVELAKNNAIKVLSESRELQDKYINDAVTEINGLNL